MKPARLSFEAGPVQKTNRKSFSKVLRPLRKCHSLLRNLLLVIETDAEILHESPMLRRSDIPKFERSTGLAIIFAIGSPKRHFRGRPIHWCSCSTIPSLYLFENFTSPIFPRRKRGQSPIKRLRQPWCGDLSSKIKVEFRRKLTDSPDRDC